ncbi:YqhA family protein [Waterburya agarophytonicola K14]|uniref:YqhA family protein n=1 Tax=Waterburya agarophytonicola KI4 TaxID=2874699 RepID=A0A964FG84_9CYAN|nr:YqhA family protein [Waterburya agarophytonicola]MCC0176263.1 YqhA family protein [Waterburya agarophytonicola KI4]
MKHKSKGKLRKIELFFEALIWNFRFFILAPVVFSLLSALRLIMIGTLDIWAGLTLTLDPKDPEGIPTIKTVAYIIGGVDYYLIGIVLLIFAFGIYELFISEIEIKHQDDSSILQSNSLEELKGKLVNVIVVALIVSLFKQMLSIEIGKLSDIIYISLAILLISISQYLLHLSHTKSSEHSIGSAKSDRDSVEH